MLCASAASDGLTQIGLSVSLPAYQSLSGKTTTNLSGLNPATTACIIHAGQSIGSNSVATGGVVTPYIPTSINHIYNLNAYDGSVTKGQDPLIGCSSPWGNYQSRLADLLVLNNLHGWTDVVLAPVAIGGSSIENWLPGANLYENYLLRSAFSGGASRLRRSAGIKVRVTSARHKPLIRQAWPLSSEP